MGVEDRWGCVGERSLPRKGEGEREGGKDGGVLNYSATIERELKKSKAGNERLKLASLKRAATLGW